MSFAEYERLKADLATDGALLERLAPLREGAVDVAAVVALLQANGYQIEAADLGAPVALSDAALDAVSAAGWLDTLKNIGSTAPPFMGRIAGSIL
ncbi:hypothetical protein GCM10007301_32740 [Azorhizobium oxalatiphilum]|uniref:Nif11 domain-containing protein n=1 Tax=Azorhizobium oxalatiphilum TaxID=980631 RepID=A0A917C3U0_9HYPH|nr:Nif11 family protein [Azorhizobium oxalatiphilum]GGF70407.1 hypothetical protein GCM10007301_32740 [Azorhizobium oxalatiphilum]